MQMPLVWLIVIVIMAILELLTAQLVSIWFVVAGSVALVISLFSDSVLLQTSVFFSITFILLLTTRPFIRKFLNVEPQDLNAGRNIGKDAIVITTINNQMGTGQINISGQIWSARSKDGSIIEKNESVQIKNIEGVKAIVIKNN